MVQSTSRRDFFKASLLAAGVMAAGSGLSACATTPVARSADAKDLRPVTVGFVPIACAAPLLVAHGRGAFERRGLKVTLRKFAGWADLWTAYTTGELDVAHMLSPMPIAANAGYTDAARPTELAFTQNTNGQAITLASRYLGKVHGVKDLKGMVIGIPFEYSVHALLLRDYLASHGVDPVRDVDLRLLRPPDMVAQLSVGSIDGFIGPEPFNQRSLLTGVGRIFIPTKDLWEGHPCCCIGVAKDVDPALKAGLVSALAEGARAAKDEAALLAQEKYLNQPEKLVAAALAGHYTTWDGRDVTDPNLLRFGDPTSAAAITWMSTQISRWGLGGALNDRDVIAAASAVLPANAVASPSPLTINGRSFDPRLPTAGLLPRQF